MLLGHENYYPKFGYKLTKEFGIKLPFEVPEENCMAIELSQNTLQNVSGNSSVSEKSLKLNNQNIFFRMKIHQQLYITTQ